MQKHAVLTLVGLALAALAVWWIEPNTTGGTSFIVVAMVLLANAIGAAIRLLPRRGTTKPKPKSTRTRDPGR